MTNSSTQHEPLFHIVKRDKMPKGKVVIIYAVAIFVALILTGIFCAASSSNGSIIKMFTSMFDGVFGTERRIWNFLKDTALLLGISLAIILSFKMKFWNLGANGQVLIASLASYACLFYGKQNQMNDTVIIVLMIVTSILASVIWSVIPAIFKAFFKTNETLFTLMMNYLAEGLVTVMITVWAPMGSGSLSPIETGTLPDIVNNQLLTILVVILVSVIVSFYLNKSKHGYELSVVGESENTARYAGMNIKKIVIRTLAFSGVICGLIGMLLTGSINHTVSTTIHSNMGFTGIMTAWLAKFNPIVLIGTCALITFVSQGMGQVRKNFAFYNDALSKVVLGVIYFFIIGCEFFINYRVIFRKKKTQAVKEEK